MSDEVERAEATAAETTTADRAPSHTVAWGYHNDVIQFAPMSALEWIADAAGTTAQVLACATWADVRSVFGVEQFEAEFGQLMDERWVDEWDGSDDPPDRPDGWVSSRDVPDVTGDWLAERPRLDDPNLLDELPAWLFEFVRGSASPMSGDFVWWDEGDLAAIQQAADEHGCRLVRRDDLTGR